MSLMAGFDIIVEVSNPTLLKLIQANLKIASVAAVPPFELDLGVARLIVNDLQLDLDPGDVIRLTVGFENSSVTSPFLIAPLDGAFVVAVRISTDSAGRPALDFANVSQSDVHITLTPASAATVQSAGVAPFLFTSLAETALHSFISVQPSFPLLPPLIQVVPGTNGGYSGSGVQVVRAEAHCLPHLIRSQQSLAICGILLAANSANGNYALKTASAIPAGDDVCVSISPDAFKQVVVCPTIRDVLIGPTAAIADLPQGCGTSPGLNNANTYGVTVTLITHTFGDGYVAFAVEGNYSPQNGVDAALRATGRFELSANGGQISSVAALDEPSVDVTLDWWVWLVSALLGPIALAAAGVAQKVAGDVAEATAKAFTKAFEGTKASFGVPYVAIAHVNTTQEGITVAGTLRPESVRVPSAQSRGVRLEGSVVTQMTAAVGNGTIQLTGCPSGVYPYEESSQTQAGSYAVLPTLMGYPLQLRWSLGSGTTWVDLLSPSGTVSLPVDCRYPLGPVVSQDVVISYRIDNPPAVTIRLQNDPADGNYRVWLSVEATDLVGNIASATTEVHFEGDHLQFGGSYAGDLAACMEAMRRRLTELGRKTKRLPPWSIPSWVPVDHPAPEVLAGFIRSVATVGGEFSVQVVRQTALAHGVHYDKAIQTRQPPRLPRKVESSD